MLEVVGQSQPIQVKICYDSEMFEIRHEDQVLFCGNFWDFNRPDDIIRILQKLKTVEVKEVEEWSD